ncbi:MAG TPA: DNA polymerase III subunit delta [Sphingomicrobium sp.]|nr:DNA polymerase III subunit delta [Sphingomicrobium sp.]
MKLGRTDIGRALDRPDSSIRLYLFHGPDESQSRGHGIRLLKSFGAEKFVVMPGAVKGDPALLADEAGALSLFGGPRVIWIDGGGDEIEAGARALLACEATESAVIVIAGALRKTSALLRLAENDRQALAYASYPPEGASAEQMIADLGRTYGLRVDRGVAARLAEACGNDRGIANQELAKLALYVDSSPETPRDLDHQALDSVGAEMAEGDWMRLADVALSGDLAGLADGLARLPSSAEPIPVVRSLQRRLLMLTPLRARVECGESLDAVLKSLGKALFFRDETLVRRLVQSWDASSLATVAGRAGKLERLLMVGPGLPPAESLGQELMAVARAGRRR